MKKFAIPAAALAFALAACGSSDDASVEAEADTVEMPADEALSDVTDMPVADPAANANAVAQAQADADDAATEANNAAEAGDRAADVAAQAQAAAAAAEAATQNAEEGM